MTAAIDTNHQATLVYQHKTKPEWGIAIIAWEADQKRGYQFEDGALRVFKDGHFHHFDEVDVSADCLERLLANARAATSPATGRAEATSRRAAISLDEQLSYFAAIEPGGFSSEQWRADHRGAGKRTLRRHRDPAITEAQRELAHEVLEACIADGREAAALAALVRVLGGTDLVPAAQLRPLAELDPSAAGPIVAALRDVLWADGALNLRFERWVGAIEAATGAGPSWMLATAPLALVHPREHVCVHPATLHGQARWMAPQLRLGPTAHAPLYARALAMVQRVHERLVEADLAPADLLDVYDFMVLTQSTKGKTAILARRSGPAT